MTRKKRDLKVLLRGEVLVGRVRVEETVLCELVECESLVERPPFGGGIS